MDFRSDFSLFPIKKIGVLGWEYRVATWPTEIDQQVHELFDGKKNSPIIYNRKNNRNGIMQNCKIVKKNNEVLMEPGDGWDYLIRMDANNNKLTNDTDDKTIPHDMKCVICLD